MGHEHVAKNKEPFAGCLFLLSCNENGRSAKSFGTFFVRMVAAESARFERGRPQLLAKELTLRHSCRYGDVAEWLKAAVC
jgi:hypothetical protein